MTDNAIQHGHDEPGDRNNIRGGKFIEKLAVNLKTTQKLSHKKWRALLKREKRRIRRQREAKIKDALDAKMENEPSVQYYEARLERQQKDEAFKQDQISKFENEQWMLREKLAHIEWKRKKERDEIERKNREEQERRIKEEWEKQQQLEREEKLREERKEKELKEKQEALLREATKNAKPEDVQDDGSSTGSWHNPLAPVTYDKDIVQCPFFMKTGACRFRNHCSRAHITPEDSCTILFPNMYSHFSLDQALRDEYDTDIDLEYEDSDTYKHFVDFYNDVLPEIRKHGRIVQFKVCRNYESHLRGNVYIQMSNQLETMKVFAMFNGRWYGGRQISCQLSPVSNWRSAICGLYFRKKCPKGKNCNFLHVFRDPTDEFRLMDRTRPSGYNSDRSYYRSSRRSRSRSRERSSYRSSRRSRSRSPSRRKRSPIRSRRSPSPNRRSPSRSRRSPSPSRRSPSRSRRSPSPSRRSPYRSRRSPSPSRRSPSRSRRSRSPSRRSPSCSSSRRRSRSPSRRSRRRSRSRSPSTKRSTTTTTRECSPDRRSKKCDESLSASSKNSHVQTSRSSETRSVETGSKTNWDRKENGLKSSAEENGLNTAPQRAKSSEFDIQIGSITPPDWSGSATPPDRSGSASPPDHQSGSITAPDRSGSTTPPDHQSGSITAPDRSGSTSPPDHQTGSITASDRSGSTTPPEQSAGLEIPDPDENGFELSVCKTPPIIVRSDTPSPERASDRDIVRSEPPAEETSKRSRSPCSEEEEEQPQEPEESEERRKSRSKHKKHKKKKSSHKHHKKSKRSSCE